MATRKPKTAAAGQSREAATAGIAPARAKRKKSPSAGNDQSIGNETRSIATPPAEMTARDAAIREQMVAQAAYYRAQLRDFAPGAELQDWLEAEEEIDGARQASWTA